MPRIKEADMFLKVRIVLTRKMRVGEAVRKLQQAARTRRVPDGIDILLMEWDKGKGKRLQQGAYIGDDAVDALRNMYYLLKNSQVRVRKAE